MSRVTEAERALVEARRLEAEESKEAARVAREQAVKVHEFERLKEGQVADLERRLKEAEKMAGGPAEYGLRLDARAWLRGFTDENGFRVDPRAVTSRDPIAAHGFALAAEATTFIEVCVQGLQGTVLDYGSDLVRRADEVERGAWQVFARRMREIACED